MLFSLQKVACGDTRHGFILWFVSHEPNCILYLFFLLNNTIATFRFCTYFVVIHGTAKNRWNKEIT